ncbi:MAG: hypothetical protein WAJ87_22015 [Bryobacteraceae bacterium]
MSSFIAILKWIFHAIVHDFWATWKKFLKYLIALLLILFGVKKMAKRPLPKRSSCEPIRHPSMKLPDPMIYDQYYLMSRGLAVSWQNPDIKILQGGVPVASDFDLQPATTCTIRATIYNQSSDGIVVDMPLEFSYLSFGMGTQSHVIPGPTQIVSLGVKGTPEGTAVAYMPWTTPAIPGHYCVQVSFEYIDDLNPFNNLGQNNTQVVQAASPAPFGFQLRNAGPTRIPFRFEFDTYQIPPPPPCPDSVSTNAKGTALVRSADVAANVRRRNSRANNPLPPGWTIEFNPETPTLDPGEEITVAATITPPDSFHGTQPVNVHAFFGNELAGGITVIVNRA